MRQSKAVVGKGRLRRRMYSRAEWLAMRPPLEEILTPRQVEVAQLVARGMCDKEIAAALGIGYQTVKNHQKSIHARLGVKCRESVAVFALTGWLPTGTACDTQIAKFQRWAA